MEASLLLTITRAQRRKINDWIHSFCYLCRNPAGDNPGPLVLTGQAEFVPMSRKLHPSTLLFYSYMCKYPMNMHRVAQLSADILVCCPCNTELEWQYATYVMGKYYGTTI